MDRGKLAYWEQLATQLPGKPIPAPSAPSAGDLALYASFAAKLAESLRGRAPDALMLGVTRGIATMAWPKDTALAAIDWSQGMVRHRWPFDAVSRAAVLIVGDWRQMPLGDASRDLVLGDGCYAAMASFADCDGLHGELSRVLRPGGHFVQRCFLRPETPEPVDQVFEDLFEGRVGGFEVFRRRLAMAMHRADRVAVSADEVWQAWHARVPEPDELARRFRWPQETFRNMERWKGLLLRFPFPALSEVRDMTRRHFDMIDCRYPDYEMGERCPMLVLRRR
jgi:SAM-dependent methyltransferase